jgi:hypothetical protein
MRRNIIFVLLFLIPSTKVLSQTALDPSFGSAGKLIVDVGESETLESITTQPDGRLLDTEVPPNCRHNKFSGAYLYSETFRDIQTNHDVSSLSKGLFLISVETIDAR